MDNELINKVDELLKNGILDLNIHKILSSLISIREFHTVNKIIDEIIKNSDKYGIINNSEKYRMIGNSEKYDELIFGKTKENTKENLIYTEKLSSLSEENAVLKEQQRLYINEMGKNLESLKEKEKEIKKISDENKELKEKTQQSRIDKNISGYVDAVKDKLNSDDKFFISMSHLWSGCGALFCIGAIAAAFYTFIDGIDTLLKNDGLNSISLFYLFTRGLLGIGLLSWLSYVCFSNSRRYTHESIRRKDRQHALMFGQIFLQIFGGTASKEDAIHVFKDWNMSGDTAFSGKTEKLLSVHVVHELFSQIKNMLPPKSEKASESNKKEDDN
ncbi:hypothetical protein [Pectobacterium aroidearum]|uniref:hypothetical protein n=1 Tax=Pectobacterium aroidearum TaxID=1201031 RepID=UPI002A8072D3|nr:hypothetical protein [Pectobacterium aroidearum]MDY4387735.1 hypothetical protein [Pectobacterium aroidearum]